MDDKRETVSKGGLVFPHPVDAILRSPVAWTAGRTSKPALCNAIFAVGCGTDN